MKKALILMLAGMLFMTFFFACGKKEEPKTEPPVVEPAVEKPAVEEMDSTLMEDSTGGMMDTTMHMEDTAG